MVGQFGADGFGDFVGLVASKRISHLLCAGESVKQSTTIRNKIKEIVKLRNP